MLVTPMEDPCRGSEFARAWYVTFYFRATRSSQQERLTLYNMVAVEQSLSNEIIPAMFPGMPSSSRFTQRH